MAEGRLWQMQLIDWLMTHNLHNKDDRFIRIKSSSILFKSLEYTITMPFPHMIDNNYGSKINSVVVSAHGAMIRRIDSS